MSSSNVTLYLPLVSTIPPSFSHLLSTYSDIAPDQQKFHIQMIRDRAYDTHNYFCLGRFRFLDLDMSTHPVYEKVISLLRSASHKVNTDPNSKPTGSEGEMLVGDGPIFLDLGCCIGQDLRKLLLDCSASMPSPPSLTSRVYGADLLPEFIDAAYALFKDGAVMPRSQFVAPADVFDAAEGNALSRLDGMVDVLHVGAFFHLFDLTRQRMVARRCLRLLRRDGGDIGGGWGMSMEDERRALGDGGTSRRTALVFGEHVGNVTAGHAARVSGGGDRYRHNEESWKRMWEEIAEEEEWKGVVKAVVVESRLEERSQISRTRDSLENGETQEKAAELEAGGDEERKKFIGKVEEGLRWHVWWVWVTFV